jgi:caffeoyl-CoA O-methyltransferase
LGVTIPETFIMKRIKKDIEQNDHAIYIEKSKGQLLKILAKSIKAKTIVEIGTLYGYSTLWLQQGLEKGGLLHTIERDPKRFEKAASYLKEYPEIIMHKGSAIDVLEKLDITADLIFIDADKNNYLAYLDWSIKHLRPGGMLVADDTLLFGAVISKDTTHKIRPSTLENMKLFNQRLKESPFESVMLPYEDGFSVALKVSV